MSNDARLRLKWKVDLLSYLKPFRVYLSKPVNKLIGEAVYGILSSGSLKMSEIARALKEDIDLHHTSKRLSRMLVKHKLHEKIESEVLCRMKPKLNDNMILAIDPGDLDRRYAEKCEFLGKVRDGSSGDIISGYPLLSVVARDGQKGKTVPLLLRVFSASEKDHVSENSEILLAMERVKRDVGSSLLWVIDRGGDRLNLWDHWLCHRFQIVVRATKQRHWKWRKRSMDAQEIAKRLPCKHSCKLRRHGDTEVKFGLTTVLLPSHPDKPLTLVVVRHGKKEPMVLISTRRAYGRRQGQALIHAYMDRWCVEEGFRFSKQGFGLEGVMARKMNALKNLVSLMLLAWSFLVNAEEDAAELKELGKADRIKNKKKKRKDKTRPAFPYYSILKGWKMLFSLATTALQHWLRKPDQYNQRKQMLIPGLITPAIWE
jgi:hypothetical protein